MQDHDPGITFTALIVGLILGVAISAAATSDICRRLWTHDAVDRGYVSYRPVGTRGESTEFKWNNEP